MLIAFISILILSNYISLMTINIYNEEWKFVSYVVTIFSWSLTDRNYVHTYKLLSLRGYNFDAYVAVKCGGSIHVPGNLRFCIKAWVPWDEGNFLLRRSSSLKFELVLKGETRKKITEETGSILGKWTDREHCGRFNKSQLEPRKCIVQDTLSYW